MWCAVVTCSRTGMKSLPISDMGISHMHFSEPQFPWFAPTVLKITSKVQCGLKHIIQSIHLTEKLVFPNQVKSESNCAHSMKALSFFLKETSSPCSHRSLTKSHEPVFSEQLGVSYLKKIQERKLLGHIQSHVGSQGHLRNSQWDSGKSGQLLRENMRARHLLLKIIPSACLFCQPTTRLSTDLCLPRILPFLHRKRILGAQGTRRSYHLQVQIFERTNHRNTGI